MIRSVLPVLAVLLAAPAARPQQAKEQEPGWADLFAKLGNYERKLEPLVLKRDAKNPVYSQTAHYLWLGGADRHYDVTVARDSAFKTLYSEEEVKKGTPAPEKIEVGKYPAWLWKYQADRKEVRPLQARLVVLLGDDRVLVIEQRGLGPFESIQSIAEKFDLKKIKAALDQPPQK